MDKSPEGVGALLEQLSPRIQARYGKRIDRLIRTRSSGLDLFQEVAFKVFKSLHTCRAESEDELAGWIMTVAKTVADRMLSSNLRCEKRSQARECSVSTEWIARLEDEELAKVEVREEAELVIKRLASLSPRQREAVELYYLGSMSYDQICARMGCTNAAARLLVSHGLRAIRKQIEKSETHLAAS